MRLFSRLFGRVPQTEEAQRARRIWAQVGLPDTQSALSRARCVVADTETGGLDPYRDGLISIGACRIEAGAVTLTDAFDVLLRQERPSDTGNVLVHGIGHAAQAAGTPPETALIAYLAFARRDVMVGFHTRFDLEVLHRAMQERLGIVYRPAHLDLALVMPTLFDLPGAAQWRLDQWLAHFRLDSFARHSALSDAFVCAQLCLIGFARAAQSGHDSLQQLLRLQKRALDQRIGQS